MEPRESAGQRVDPKTLFTIGYEGLTPIEFVARLQANGISRLVDVREVAFSRKPGFSKTSLRSHLAENGIEYVHMSRLGSPEPIRKAFKSSGDLTAFSESYRSHLAVVSSDLDRLVTFALDCPTAIMCFERAVEQCHRGIIASSLVQRGFSVKNL